MSWDSADWVGPSFRYLTQIPTFTMMTNLLFPFLFVEDKMWHATMHKDLKKPQQNAEPTLLLRSKLPSKLLWPLLRLSQPLWLVLRSCHLLIENSSHPILFLIRSAFVAKEEVSASQTWVWVDSSDQSLRPRKRFWHLKHGYESSSSRLPASPIPLHAYLLAQAISQFSSL